MTYKIKVELKISLYNIFENTVFVNLSSYLILLLYLLTAYKLYMIT